MLKNNNNTNRLIGYILDVDDHDHDYDYDDDDDDPGEIINREESLFRQKREKMDRIIKKFQWQW